MKDDFWVEADGLEEESSDSKQQQDDGDMGLGNLFADPDPYETFKYLMRDNRFMVTLEGVKAENGQTLQSTGRTLWRAAPQLCDFLQADPERVRGKRVLEIGAGLGLCSIVAHLLGAKSVVSTDGDVHVLEGLRHNVARNVPSNNILVQQLRWGRQHLDTFVQVVEKKFDVILAADVIYVEESLGLFFETVEALLAAPRGQFVLSYACRNVPLHLVKETAQRFGFEWNNSTHSSSSSSSERVYVLQRSKL